VQLVRKTSTLVLLGGDQLVRQPGALGLAHACVAQQFCVFVLACGEVRQHSCAHHVVAIEGTLTGQPQRADLFVVRAQRNHDCVLRRRLPRSLARA
jgi:hypothetical protein